jgi:hypothetical protein
MWESVGFTPIIGECPPGPWRKALAVQDGVDRTDGDRLVIVDADVWPSPWHTFEALRSDRPVVVPHHTVHRLTEAGTTMLITGQPVPYEHERHGQYKGRVGGGVIVIDRTVYNEVPFDPRFEGWGHEDDSWNRAITILAGKPLRLDGDLWHLWHPPQERVDRGHGSPQSVALERRYMTATHAARKQGDLAPMRALVDEARQEVDLWRSSNRTSSPPISG